VKAAVVLFPGSNRERDMAVAIEHATGQAPAIVWHGDTTLPKVDLIVLPGGFSYGDYLRSGAIAARAPIMRSVVEAAEKGVAVLGVCNGFQILTEAGLLPGVLLPNAHGKFACKNVSLRVETSQTIFTGGYEAGQTISVPIAHHDGNYFADDATLDRLEGEGRVAFRYVGGNPNGSIRDIAGVYSETKTVLGLMPHPEDATDPGQGGIDGLGLFTGLANALS